MTIVKRRSNRSASTPATGPSTSAGSSRIAITPPNAAPLAVLPVDLRGGEDGGGEQAEPVTEGGHAEHDPEPAERPDPQHGPDRRRSGPIGLGGAAGRWTG